MDNGNDLTLQCSIVERILLIEISAIFYFSFQGEIAKCFGFSDFGSFQPMPPDAGYTVATIALKGNISVKVIAKIINACQMLYVFV